MHGIQIVLKKINNYSYLFKENMNIIEIGSSRDDGSTFYLSKLCLKYKMNLYTIDPDEKSNRNALDVFAKFDCPANLHAILEKGEVYLKNNAPKGIVLAYLDGFDIVTKHPHKQSTIDAYNKQGIDLLKDGNRISAEIHLETTKYIVENSVPQNIICFDDTWCENGNWMGKGATAVPYLLENDYSLITPPSRKWYFRKKYNHGVALMKAY